MSKYNEVYFVLCLTETGREHAWLPVPDPVPDIDTDQFVAELEQQIIDSIYNQYGDRDLNKLIVCRNFTQSFATTQYHTKHLKPWIQINWENDSTDYILQDILINGPTTQMGIEPLWFLESYENYMSRKHDQIDMLYGFLENSKYHSHKATKHPTAQSHLLWADYLGQQFALMN